MKTKLIAFSLLTVSFYASAEKLEINSTTTTADLRNQLIKKQPTEQELGDAWNEADNLKRRDLADFLFPYMTGEQPLPQNQVVQNEAKEEKSESEDDLNETEKQLSHWLEVLNFHQMRKATLLAGGGGNMLHYLNNLGVPPAQFGAAIDAEYQRFYGHGPRASAADFACVKPIQEEKFAWVKQYREENPDEPAQEQTRVAPLVLNADAVNAPYNPCQMVSAVVVILASMLLYSQFGAV